jgi:hypothetical protein
MTDKPDPSLFSVDLREGQYEAVFAVSGTVQHTIKATSLEDARAQAHAMIEEVSEIAVGLHDEDISLDRVRPKPPMYRITRGGQKISASFLLPGDLPRDPDESGF